jgi:hypothetical protein
VSGEEKTWRPAHIGGWRIVMDHVAVAVMEIIEDIGKGSSGK